MAGLGGLPSGRAGFGGSRQQRKRDGVAVEAVAARQTGYRRTPSCWVLSQTYRLDLDHDKPFAAGERLWRRRLEVLDTGSSHFDVLLVAALPRRDHETVDGAVEPHLGPFRGPRAVSDLAVAEPEAACRNCRAPDGNRRPPRASAV